MKKFFTICLVLIGAEVFCQVGGVGISPNGGAPDPSAALDIKYTNKGLLMPRLTTVQMDSISAPASGLLIYNSDSSAFYYYTGSIWINLSPAFPVFLPTVLSTTAASSITVGTAASGGAVSSNGGAAVTAYGVCWGTSPNPVLGGGNYTADGTGTGTFASSITGLAGATDYYARAYATNSAGTAYGPQITFTTPNVPTVLSTTAATAITGHTASSGGNVTADGGEPVTAYGVCWSTSPNPVLGVGNYTDDGAGIGIFTSNITGLTDSTTYYVRAYATSSVGTGYGPQITLITMAHGIGDSYGGGIIAYILQPGDNGYNANVIHGLIAATSDQSAGIQWYNGHNTTTNATGTAIGTGANNTALIIASQGGGSYAATVCTTYTGGGYNDWYLPSIAELNELSINYAAIGGFTGNWYWSSSEEGGNNNQAWDELMNNTDNQGQAPKSSTFSVRPVRSF